MQSNRWLILALIALGMALLVDLGGDLLAVPMVDQCPWYAEGRPTLRGPAQAALRSPARPAGPLNGG